MESGAVLSIVVPVTCGAESEHGEVIDRRSKSVSFLYRLAQRRDEIVVQFEDGATAVADEVMMRLVDQLELPDALAEIGFADQAQVAIQLEGTVDRRAVDRRQLRRNPGENFVGGEMFTLLQRTEDDQPLRRHPLTNPAQAIRQSARGMLLFLVHDWHNLGVLHSPSMTGYGSLGRVVRTWSGLLPFAHDQSRMDSGVVAKSRICILSTISRGAQPRVHFPREAHQVPVSLIHRRRFLAATFGAALVGTLPYVSARAQDRSLGWSDELVDDNGKLNVVTTVAPISSIVRNVGGDRIDLHGIVPDGTNSHTFEPAPSDARTLSLADIVFVNGLDLEQPTMDLAEANLRDGGEIVALGEQTITPDQWVFDFSFPKEAGSPNPHLWPNPAFALRYAEIMRDSLSKRDPANASYYSANYDAFAKRIAALEDAIKVTIASIPEQNRKLLTYHDSWAYFAPVYGMSVIGAIQPSDFSEPSAKDIADLIQQIRAEKVPAIFGSEVFPSPVLEQIARETGAKYVDDLRDDDLPGSPGEPQHSYLGLMAANMNVMAKALGGDPSIIAKLDTSNVTGVDSAVQQNQ